GAVNHVAAVVLRVGGEGIFGGDGQHPPLGGLRRDGLHRFRVDLTEPDAGTYDREGRVGGLTHGFVHEALHGAEGAVDGDGAGDVGGVVAVEFDARVDEDEVAVVDGAVVAGPVEDARVRAGCGDGVIADGVALRAGAAVEGAFHESFSARVRDDLGQVG